VSGFPVLAIEAGDEINPIALVAVGIVGWIGP
jgi:hypothetical protein